MAIYHAAEDHYEYASLDLSTSKPHYMQFNGQNILVGRYTQGKDFDGSVYYYATSEFEPDTEWTCGGRLSSTLFWLELTALTAGRA